MDIYVAHTGYGQRELVLPQLGVPDIDLSFLRNRWGFWWGKVNGEQ